MYTLICGFIFFCIAFLFHMAILRFRIQKNPLRTLLLIFFSIVFSGLFILWFCQIGPNLFGRKLIFEYIHISLFFTALTFTYCLVYVFLIDDAPSLFTFMSIFNAGEKGMSKTELSDLITDDIFIKPRLEFLVKEKMVYKFESNYLLGPKGHKLLSIFIFIQKVMKISKKPG